MYGPPLADGFYYDIAFPEERPLREGDFEAIEAEMAKIVAEDRPFTRYELAKRMVWRSSNPKGANSKLTTPKELLMPDQQVSPGTQPELPENTGRICAAGPTCLQPDGSEPSKSCHWPAVTGMEMLIPTASLESMAPLFSQRATPSVSGRKRRSQSTRPPCVG